MNMISRVVAAVVLTFAPAAFAQTWIVPTAGCGEVTFQLTQGGSFPTLGQAIDVDRIARTWVQVAKRRVELKPVSAPFAAEFSAVVPEGELAVVAAELKPVVAGNETRTEEAKALVGCRNKAGEGNWRLSAGLRLEIFPQWNEGFPLKRGHEMRFIVVDNAQNQLVRSVRLELYRAGEGHLGSAESNPSGIVTFPETAPGRYLVTGTVTRPDPKLADHQLVDTTSLTFEVK